MSSILRRRGLSALPLTPSESILHATAAPFGVLAATSDSRLLHSSALSASPASSESPAESARAQGAILDVGVARVTALCASGLPEESALALALVENVGVNVFSLPRLAPVPCAPLEEVSVCAALFALDQLGQAANAADSFRIAFAFNEAALIAHEDKRAAEAAAAELSGAGDGGREDAPEGVAKSSLMSDVGGSLAVRNSAARVTVPLDAGAVADPRPSVIALYEVTPGVGTASAAAPSVELLGSTVIDHPVYSLAFGGLTLVATGPDDHYMIRIARSGSLALASTVPRFELVPVRARRKRRPRSEVEQPSKPAGLLSIFGGLFGAKSGEDERDVARPLYAIPMPEERWLLVVDNELVAHSSFGAKIEEMENVFKSREGIALAVESANENPSSAVAGGSAGGSVRGSGSVNFGRSQRGAVDAAGLARSVSVSSFGSIATGITSATVTDEAGVTRTEKTPLDTVFVSPFVLSMASASELLVFSANGSVPGGIEYVNVLLDSTDAVDDEASDAADWALSEASNTNLAGSPSRAGPSEVAQIRRQDGQPSGALAKVKADARSVRLVPTPDSLPRVAYIVWPDGDVAEIELARSLGELTDYYESEGELRLALSLVPVEDLDRTLRLRRMLAQEARGLDWHDGAIKHMEAIVNIVMKGDTYAAAQQDLILEAVELRGTADPSWRADPMTATLWADFFFQLRRRVMRPSASDAAVLETLCAVDISANRVRKLFATPHAVPIGEGESLITAQECVMAENERVVALVALYQSLGSHDKALSLLEESGSPVDVICEYLATHVKAEESPADYFRHLDWLAADESRHDKLMTLLVGQLPQAACSRVVLTESLNTLVKGAPHLIPTYVEQVLTSSGDVDGAQGSSDPDGESRTDILARALLAAMTTAQSLEKKSVIAEVRPIFRKQVLQRGRADYDTSSMLAALRECETLSLHEELAYLLGQQGNHSAAASELAAEDSISASEATKRLQRHVPAAMRKEAAAALAVAYLRMAASNKEGGAAAAAEIVGAENGRLDAADILRKASGERDILALVDARQFAISAITAGTERLRLAQMLRAVRKSEARRQREELLMRRRQHIVLTRDSVCVKCSRPIGEAVFVAYPNGGVAHLACHISSTDKLASHGQ